MLLFNKILIYFITDSFCKRISTINFALLDFLTYQRLILRRFQHPERLDSKRILYFVLRTGAQKQHHSRSISGVQDYTTTRLVKTSRFLLQMNRNGRTRRGGIWYCFVVEDNKYLFSTVMLKGLQSNLILCNNHNWDVFKTN